MVESRVNDLEVLLAGVERRLDQMQQALTTQQGSTNLMEASHQQLHREVRDMVESIRTQRPGPHAPPVDKALLPDPYAQEKAKRLIWSLRFKRYLNRRHPGIKAHMDRIEGQVAPLTQEALTDIGIGTEAQDDILDYLILPEKDTEDYEEGIALGLNTWQEFNVQLQ